MHETPNRRTELRPENRELLAQFEAETARGKSRTASTFRVRLGGALRRYRRAHGEEPLLSEAVADVEQLALLVGNDVSHVDGHRLSIKTIYGTIDALRALIAWMPAEAPAERRDRRAVLDDALSAIATTRGLRKVLPIGERRAAAREPVSRAEVHAIISELRSLEHPLGYVAADLVGFLYQTGVRVGAALELERRHLVRGPGGRWCVTVREKASPDQRLVLVRSPRKRALIARWERLSRDAPLWGRGGLRLTDGVFRRLFARAAERARIERKVVPHLLRHGFATDAARAVGYATAKRAGGWASDDIAQGYMH